MSPFEIGMLVCFGVSWPFAVYKTWKTKTCKGKSFVFLWLVVIGYVSGMLHKVYYHFDGVIWLYALNAVLVSTDLALSYKYRMNDVPVPVAATVLTDDLGDAVR